MTGENDGGASTVLDAESLASRIQRGDSAAESEFVAGYRAGVHALVRRHCRPLEPAVDDLCQDVLLAVLQKLREGALKDVAALPAYVRSAVVMTVQAEYRKRARRGEHLGEEAIDSAQAEAEPVRSSEEPSTRMHREQVGKRVRELLSELEVERDREVLRRFYLLEHERELICRDLGIEESHFRRVLFRARTRMADLARRSGLEPSP